MGGSSIRNLRLRNKVGQLWHHPESIEKQVWRSQKITYVAKITYITKLRTQIVARSKSTRRLIHHQGIKSYDVVVRSSACLILKIWASHNWVTIVPWSTVFETPFCSRHNKVTQNSVTASRWRKSEVGWTVERECTDQSSGYHSNLNPLNAGTLSKYQNLKWVAIELFLFDEVQSLELHFCSKHNRFMQLWSPSRSPNADM